MPKEGTILLGATTIKVLRYSIRTVEEFNQNYPPGEGSLTICEAYCTDWKTQLVPMILQSKNLNEPLESQKSSYLKITFQRRVYPSKNSLARLMAAGPS